MAGMFRLLRADEIDVRVSREMQSGCAVLLYKDARCDMNILDETVGPQRWQRHHSRDNANCIVAIYFDGIGWVEKEDTGTESNTEAAKGLASDSFKRSCFNWGIGRELYTAPKFIFIPSDKLTKNPKTGKISTTFAVSHIAYDEHQEICELIIVDASSGKTLYSYKGNNRVFVPTHADEKATEQPTLAQKAQSIAKTEAKPASYTSVKEQPQVGASKLTTVSKTDKIPAQDELSQYKRGVFFKLCEELGMSQKELQDNAKEIINAGLVSKPDMKSMDKEEFNDLIDILRSNFTKTA